MALSWNWMEVVLDRMEAQLLFGNAVMASAIGVRFSKDRIALLGQDNQYRAPVYPGDSLNISWTVTDVRPTSQVGRNVLTMTGQMRNQHGVVVLDATVKAVWFGVAE